MRDEHTRYAIEKANERIAQLAEMVNSYSAKLGLGRKVRAEDWIITEQDYSHVRRGIAPREEQAEGLLRKSLEAFESMPRSLAYNITHGNEIRAWLSADKE